MHGSHLHMHLKLGVPPCLLGRNDPYKPVEVKDRPDLEADVRYRRYVRLWYCSPAVEQS